MHALCPQARNLTDDQLKAIRDSKGIVGLNFDVAFLRKDGQRDANTSIDVILKHLEYLIDEIGIDHVGFGSDFDGALISHEIGDVRGLHLLIERMQKRHYSHEIIEKICFSNWWTVLNRILDE